MPSKALPDSTARFCSKCGSPAVDFSSLEGGEATCRSCGWTGSKDELLVHHFTHTFSSQADILAAFSKDVRDLMTEMGPTFIKLLLRWGFIGKAEVKVVVPYFKAVSVAIATAVMQTREELAKSKHHGG